MFDEGDKEAMDALSDDDLLESTGLEKETLAGSRRAANEPLVPGQPQKKLKA